MGRTSREVARLLAKARKTSLAVRMQSLSDNEIAAAMRCSDVPFLRSIAWRELRERVIKHYGAVCMCCGATPQPWNLNVDHIKPRKFFHELALEFENLQVLCGRCNKAKGNKTQTDYRGSCDDRRLDKQQRSEHVR